MIDSAAVRGGWCGVASRLISKAWPESPRSASIATSRRSGDSTLPERSPASSALLKDRAEEVLALQRRALGGLQVSKSMLARGSDPLLLRRASMALQSSMRWTLLSDEGFGLYDTDVKALMVANGMYLMLAEGIQIR